MMSIEISLLVAVIGCFVGLAGWLSKRDDNLLDDAEWKGVVNTKLDTIIGLNGMVVDHEKRLTEVEQSSGNARRGRTEKFMRR